MELTKAKKLAEELLEKHNPDYTLRFDNAKIRLGCCNVSKKYISLSRPFILLNNEEAVKDTILHEIAHSLTPQHKHNNIWRAKAIEIGCNGNRICNDENVIIPKGKYVFQCPKCKKKVFAYRKQRIEKSCGKCCKAYNNNKFSKDYVLELIEVQ